MFRRRIFYNAGTGAVLHAYAASGDINANYPTAQEAACLGLADWAAFAWDLPDLAIEAAFAPVDAEGAPRSVKVSVDVSGTEPQLVFAYAPVPAQDTTEAELLSILTGNSTGGETL